MIVQVAFVQMGADRTLKPIRKKPLCKFTANLVYLVGRGFTGAETLYDGVGQNSLSVGCSHNRLVNSMLIQAVSWSQ